MKIGFSGPRRGISVLQVERLKTFPFIVTEFHHGDCVGADAQAHSLFLSSKIHIHPPTNPRYRAWCKADVLYPEKDYLIRNRDIVDACDLFVACPGGPERLRSGTWSTIRYAKRIGKDVLIIYPDGTTLKV